MVHLRLVEKGAGPERVAVVGEVGEVGRQRPATGQSGRGRVRSRGGIERSRRSRRGRRVRRHRRPSPPRRIRRRAWDGALVPVLGRRGSNLAGRREDILRPLGRVRPRAGVELRRGGRRARARAGVSRGWVRVPRTRARVRRLAGGRERHRARARRRSRGSLLLFLRRAGARQTPVEKEKTGMRAWSRDAATGKRKGRSAGRATNLGRGLARRRVSRRVSRERVPSGDGTLRC